MPRARPPRSERGLVIFLTGLSGSGKSTIARGLRDALSERGDRTVSLLDGLVLARAIMHHSANYRSAVLLGRARSLETASEKLVALEALLDARERGFDLAQREARGGELARQELGLGLRALVDEAILLGAQPVALGLAVLALHEDE